MYSRATPFEKSDKVIGTHQKIDRAARLVLRNVTANIYDENLDNMFPKIDQILKFEGTNGPDGIKLKSPGKDEPWHFVNPNGDFKPIFSYAENHIFNLTEALKKQDYVRASFEAAWLAHVLTDALTPAHQYPMTKKITELSGRAPGERDKFFKKMFIDGDTLRDTVKKNWEYMGPRGVMSSHLLYEMGVAVLISPIAPRKFAKKPSRFDIERTLNGKFFDVFGEKIKLVHDKKYFERFMEHGWTSSLAIETREDLLPEISALVTLGWLAAINKARSEHEPTHNFRLP